MIRHPAFGASTRRARLHGAGAVVRAVAACALVVLAGSCARKGPPSGGPPDMVPPRVVASVPDSGAAAVPRDARLSVTFSESMEPRSAGDAFSLSPPVEIVQQRWSGRTLTLVLGDTLAANRTYTWFVSPGARDRHGNPLERGYAFVFTTAESLPKGVLEGTLEARGFSATGTYLWCYDAARTGVPDSTARDFDALGFVDREGGFRVVGLPAPGRYRLWVFADLDRNRSFEPERDVLAAADTLIELTAEQPTLSGIRLRVTNPRAPATVKATVVDTLGMTAGGLWARAVPADSTLTRRFEPLAAEEFELSLPAGTWNLRVFRDLDRSRTWDEGVEPASDEIVLTLGPADEVTKLVFVIRRPAAR